jgi:Rad3-related DNA helicase
MDKFQDIDIDELFPYRKDGKASYRKGQKESIMKALTALVEQDYSVFILDCPVGFGKSATIVTLSRVISELGYDSYITTPQILLQDQYEVEFPEISQIKGRSNYSCVADPDVTCSTGECQLSDSYIKNHQDVCSKCIYLNQRNKCQESSVCGMNTSYLMTVSQQVFGKRYLFSVDEAHSVPEWGVGFVSVTIRASSVGGFIPDFPSGFAAYIIWLEKTVYPQIKAEEERLREELKEFGGAKGRKVILGKIEAYKAVVDILKKIDLLSKDYAENGEDWIYTIVDDIKGKKIVFQPLTSGRFLSRILWSRGEKILLSSGTITPELYIKEAGLNSRKFNMKDCVIEVPSEFDPKKSPIYYKPCGKLTYDKKAFTLPVILKEIEKVILGKPEDKGIIHSFSYENAKYIVDNITPSLRDHLWIQDRLDRSGSLDKWINSDEPSVFLSTNMSEGLNLKGDLCRYQIYMKIGYPSIADKRVAKRLELGHRTWYATQAIEDLEQSSGRATRSVDDYSDMYIFDSSFADLYIKNIKLFKMWFKNRLVFIQN